MNARTLTVYRDQIKALDRYECLLTGRLCDVVPVTLRRMKIVLIHWHGVRSVIRLPLEESPQLVHWQYPRMVRPYLAFAALLLYLWLLIDLGVRPTGVLSFAICISMLLVPAGVWFIIGWLLNHFEFVHLIRYNRSADTVTLKFSTQEIADRAKAVLIEQH